MTDLDRERRIVADQVKKFEQAARDIHALADKLHKRLEELHRETIAVRERARAARKSAETEAGSTWVREEILDRRGTVNLKM